MRQRMGIVRKIPTETNSFQAVLLPLQPARFPHQIDDSTCWQIGWATNCTKNTQREIKDEFYVFFSSSLNDSSFCIKLPVSDCS